MSIDSRLGPSDGFVSDAGRAQPNNLDDWSISQVRYLYSNLPIALICGLGVAILIGIVQWSTAATTHTALWLSIFVVVTIGRASLVPIYRRSSSGNPAHAAGLGLQRYRIGAAAGGLAWGLGSLLLFVDGNVEQQLLLGLAIAGVSCGAATSMGTDRISLLLFAVPALIIPAVLFFADGGGLQMAAGMILILYVAFVVLTGKRARQWLNELSILRTEASERAAALHASEARYRDLFENSTDLIQSVGTDGCLLFVNRAWRETLGYSNLEVIGQSAFDYIAPAYRDHCQAMLARLISGEQCDMFDVDFVAKDGRLIALEGRVNIRFENGVPISTRGIFRDVSARRAAERKLVENQQLLDSIIENLPAMVFLKDAKDLRFERFNRAGEALLGFSRDEVLGKNDYDMMPDDQADAFTSIDRQVVAHGKSREIIEEPITTRDGEVRYLHTAKVALHDNTGEVSHLLGVSVDITDQRRAEAALRDLNAALEARVEERTAALAQSERFNRATLDAIAARLAVLDQDGKILATNAAWRCHATASDCAWHALDEGENYLNACEQTTDPLTQRVSMTIATEIRHVISGRDQSIAHEYSSEVGDRTHWFLCRISRFEAAGSPRIVVTHDDVTDIHETREQLAAGQRMIASLEQVSPVGIFRVDAHGMCDFVNARYCEITGLTEAGAKGLGWQRAVHPDDREQVFGTWKQAVNNRAHAQVEYRFLHADGTIRWVIGQVVEIAGPDGGIAGYIGTLTDVTDRRALEMQLAQAMKMDAMGKLTGGMAHDFNNYLGVIIGNLDLVQESETADPAATTLIDSALSGALRAADLTKSLLAFSHRQPLDPRIANVNELLHNAVAMLQRTLGEDIALSIDFDDSLKPVRIDHAQLDSSIVNLASNARDAMPDGGTLTIATRSRQFDDAYVELHPSVTPGDYVMIEVRDSGGGIDPDTLDRVLEPFFTTKPKGHGTGLGLSMVYGFAKQSGGHLEIESESGHGTAVRMYLPADVSYVDDDAILHDDGFSTTSPSGDETIIVVEDNEQLRRTTVDQLITLGYRVIEAENGDAARALIEDDDLALDLLFTDIVMPGELDGYRLAKRALAHRPEIKVLLTSGFPGDSLATENGQEPSFRLLGKPYRKQELAVAVRQELDAPIAHRVAAQTLLNPSSGTNQ